ncbi:MAG: nucleotidyltransferase family protein [Oscillospiraceae bacterium]
MKTCGIISEYNPFHNGHKYQLKQAREMGYSHIVCVMSGDFVQRGDIAINDKYIRAENAVKNGADLVLMLPTKYTLSSAELFAQNGVDLLNSVGIEALCFGSECGDVDKLILLANKQINPKEYLKQGMSYPKAIGLCYGEDLLSNDILAIEYIKAIGKKNITPIALNRIGVNHDSQTACNNIASASCIRELMFNHKDFSEYVPENCNINSPITLESIEKLILYKLKSLTAQQLCDYAEVSEGLNNRIYNAASQAVNIGQFYDLLKTKRYPMARLKRIVCCILLDIKKNSLVENSPRVLAFNQKGAEIIKKYNLTVNFKDYYDEHYENLISDINASEIFSLCSNLPKGKDFTTKIKMIK